MTSLSFRESVWPALEASARARLEAFAADLLRYNRAQNLISRRLPEAQLALLFEECVSAARLLEARGFLGRAWADVGTGAGFPGVVLACLFPDQPLVLIERRTGRCDFLRREVHALGLAKAEVLEADASAVHRDPFDLVLAKAVAPPGEIERLTGALVGPEGALVVFGRRADRPGEGWVQAWADALPGDDSVLRGLVRGPR